MKALTHMLFSKLDSVFTEGAFAEALAVALVDLHLVKRAPQVHLFNAPGKKN